MLDIIRKKKDSPWVKGILLAIALSFFGGFGLLGYCSKKESAEQMKRNTAATVNGKAISVLDVNRVYQNLAEGKRPKNDADRAKLREDALNNLINQELVFEAATKMGITATDQEVQDTIVKMFERQGGTFNAEFLANYLQNLGLSDEQFAERIKREIIVQKMLGMVGASAIVTEDDIDQLYRYDNSMTNISVIVLDPEKITEVTEPTPEEIKARFDSNEEGYSIPEKRSINYLCFEAKKYSANYVVTDQEIQNMYDRAREGRYVISPRKVKVRQIMLKADLSMSEEERNKVKEKAQKILSDAKLGTFSFEELARQNTEDAATKENGGDLGWFDYGTKTGPVAKALLTMKPGDISDVIDDPTGYYIFKLEEETPGKYKPLSAVRNEIIEDLKRREGFKGANAAAKDLTSKINEGITFQEAAKQATAEIKVTAPFEASATEIEGIEEPAQFVSNAFKLWDINQVSDYIPVQMGACVIQLASIQESRQADFDEAVPLVKKELIAEKKKAKAKELADAMLKDIQGGKTFEQVGATPPAEMFETDFFSRERRMIPNVGFSEDMISAAFALPAHDPIAKQVFEVSGKFYLVKLIAHKDADPAGFQAKREMLKMQLTMLRQAELAESWVESLKDKATIVKNTQTE